MTRMAKTRSRAHPLGWVKGPRALTGRVSRTDDAPSDASDYLTRRFIRAPTRIVI